MTEIDGTPSKFLQKKKYYSETRLKFAVSIMVLVLCGAGHADVVPYVDSPKYSLIDVKVFAFGGIGFAGTTSEGEKAFHAVFSEPQATALADFDSIYTNGTPEAKSYALVAIRKLDPKHFKILLLLLHSSNETVLTETGCILRRRRLTRVAKDIDSGQYDFWLKPRKQSQ